MLRLVALFLLLAFPSEAATYYISSTGNDSLAGTSPATAWLTVTKANTATSSDTVSFQAGGSWTGKLQPSADHISYNVYGTGAAPIINGSGSDYAFYSNSRNLLSVIGLDFENVGFAAAFIQTSFQPMTSGTYTNNKFGVTGGNPASTPIILMTVANGNPMSGLNFSGNEFTNPAGRQGFQISHNTSSIHDITWYNNNFHDIGSFAIQIFTSSETDVVNNNAQPYGLDLNLNTFTNIGASVISTGTGMFSTPTQSYVRNNTLTNIGTVSTPNVNAIQLSYAIGVKVYGNIIRNIFTSVADGDGIILDFAWTDLARSSSGCDVFSNSITGATAGSFSAGVNVYHGANNRIYNNFAYGSNVGFRNANADSTGNVFSHNTSVGNVYGSNIDTSSPATTWTDNIFANNTTAGMRVANSSTTPTENFNDWFGNAANILVNGSPISIDGTDLTVDPKFVSANNYSLQPSSPLIGAATNSPVPDIGASFFRP